MHHQANEEDGQFFSPPPAPKELKPKQYPQPASEIKDKPVPMRPAQKVVYDPIGPAASKSHQAKQKATVKCSDQMVQADMPRSAHVLAK